VVRRTATVLIAAWAMLWLLAGYWSPLNPLIAHGICRLVGKQQSGTTLSCARAGLGIGLHSVMVSGLTVSAPGIERVELDQCLVRFRWLPFLCGRLSMRAVAVDGLRARITAGPPQPATPAAPQDQWQELRRQLDLGHPPFVLLTNATIAVTVASTDAPPLSITLTNVHVRCRTLGRKERKGDGLPYGLLAAANLQVGDGSSAVLRAEGRLDPAAEKADEIPVDLTLSVAALSLPGFNPVLEAKAPFSVDRGTVGLQLDACARNGRLSGLCSVSVHGLEIRRNAESRSATYLAMSFSAWEFLVRQRNGDIQTECQIEGTLLKPVIPVGAALRKMAGDTGRNMTTRFLSTIGAGSVADRIKTNAARRAKHDDILKIQRLPSCEQHYERGQHYETVAKNYTTAIEEYSAQLKEYPAETNTAILSLQASAGIRRRRQNDQPGAIADLRRILTDYGNHPDADNALYEMTQIAVEAKEYPLADRLCREFLETYPSSELKDRVLQTRRDISRFVW